MSQSRKLVLLFLSLILCSYTAAAQYKEYTDHLSCSDVLSFCEGKDGSLWIGTSHGLNRYNGSEYESFYASSEAGSMTSDFCNALLEDSQGNIWVGTNLGLNVLRGGKFHHPSSISFNPINKIKEFDDMFLIVSQGYSIAAVNKNSLAQVSYFTEKGAARTSALEVDNLGHIWVGVDSRPTRSVVVLDFSMNVIARIDNPSPSAFIGSFTSGNTIWIYSKDGIYSYDTSTMEENTPSSLSGLVKGKNILFASAYGSNKIVLGIKNEGIVSFDTLSGEKEDLFKGESLLKSEYSSFVDSSNGLWLSDRQEDPVYLSGDSIQHLNSYLSSIDGNIIRGTGFSSDGLLYMASPTQLIAIDPATGETISTLEGHAFRQILADSKGGIWLISNSGNAARCVPDIKGKLKATDSFKPEFPIASIAEGSDGEFYMLLSRKIAKVSPDRTLKMKDLPNGIVPYLLTQTSGKTKEVLAMDYSGLYRIKSDLSFEQIITFNFSGATCCCCDVEGNYWIGTSLGLRCYDSSTKTFRLYDKSSGLPDNTVQSLLPDADGNLWVTTITGLVKIDLKANSVTSFEKTRTGYYAPNGALKGPDGKLYFVRTDGITVVDPKSINASFKRTISLESLAVNGTNVDNTLTSRFKHDCNTFAFKLSSIDLKSRSEIYYRYKLTPIDKSWEGRTDSSLATFANLPPGRYTFMAQVCNADGTWNPETVSYSFRILRHPLLSVVANVIYTILILAALMFLAYKYSRYIRKRREWLFAKQQNEFLLNLSHELKTPLSLVYGPLQQLKADSSVMQNNGEIVEVMERNVGRLKEVASRLLDSGKSLEKEGRLDVSEYNLSDIIKQYSSNFLILAVQKEINLEIGEIPDIKAWFDRDKVEKILSNLISNAIKYTDSGGHVKVGCTVSPKGIMSLSVEDDGIGIPEQKQSSLFSRFNRLGREISGVEGQGIGLNYSQYLAYVHRGAIKYEPVSPHGSRFILNISILLSSYNDDEIRIASSNNSVLTPEPLSEEQVKDRTILIADDDRDMSLYVKSLFAADWNVVIAMNGLVAKDLLMTQVVPDIIISDVAMPGMTGVELCKEVKANDSTMDIPFILLSAMTESEDYISGSNAGADSYVPKPFDPKVLVAEVENLYRKRQIHQQRLLANAGLSHDESSGDTISEDAENANLREVDRKFLSKVQEVMEKNLSQEEFHVNDMANELGMSYFTLYSRVKNLTGQTPQAYFNTYRMNVAMNLLKEGELTVSEVSYKVGASSISNFSRSFKKQFGIPPSSVEKA